MALPDWVVATGVIGGALGALVAAFRAKPEARKLKADAAAAVVSSAGAMLTSVEHEMADLRSQVKEMRQWRSGLEGRLRRHAKWDATVVAQIRENGGVVGDPPPLYDDDEAGDVPAPREGGARP